MIKYCNYIHILTCSIKYIQTPRPTSRHPSIQFSVTDLKPHKQKQFPLPKSGINSLLDPGHISAPPAVQRIPGSSSRKLRDQDIPCFFSNKYPATDPELRFSRSMRTRSLTTKLIRVTANKVGSPGAQRGIASTLI